MGNISLSKTLKPLLPISISILVGLIFLWIVRISIPPVEAVPFSEEKQGTIASGLNAFFYIFMSLVVAYFLVYLLKKNKILFIRLMIGGAFFFSSFIILLYVSLSLSYIFSNDILSLASLILSIIFSVFIAVSVTTLRFPLSIRNVLITILGGLLGFFLGYNIPTWSAFAILIGMSLYDIFAVKKGPIKTIVNIIDEKGEKESLPFLGYTSESWQMGLGDLVFYTLLVTHITNFFGFLDGLLSFLGILIGSLFTFYFLEKEKMLPGLPLAIFSGLGLFYLHHLILYLFSLL
ncbi:MAG: hypothetical protein ACP6IS_12055 [Candidatus Asgardarchaeia archaeon]